MMQSVPLAILFALAALFSLFELWRERGSDAPTAAAYLAGREAHGAHVVMNGAMAAMFAPFYDSGIERVAVAALVLLALVLSVRALLSVRAGVTARAGGSLYHLFGAAAMLFAIWLMPAAMEHGMAGGMAHMAHDMGQRTGSGGGAHWLAIALGVIFIIDAVATALLAGFAPRLLVRMADEAGVASPPAPGENRHVHALLRRSAVPHVVMDVGMALMLL